MQLVLIGISTPAKHPASLLFCNSITLVKKVYLLREATYKNKKQIRIYVQE